MGHLNQGPFKSFPCQADEHFLTVCRYVKRNALNGKLVSVQKIGSSVRYIVGTNLGVREVENSQRRSTKCGGPSRLDFVAYLGLNLVLVWPIGRFVFGFRVVVALNR